MKPNDAKLSLQTFPKSIRLKILSYRHYGKYGGGEFVHAAGRGATRVFALIIAHKLVKNSSRGL